MLVKRRRGWELSPSEITPENLFRDRRRLLATLGVGALGVAAGGWPAGAEPEAAGAAARQAPLPPATRNAAFTLDRPLTEERLAASHNIFDEFAAEKAEVASAAAGFRTSPWRIQLGGVIESAKSFEVEELEQRLGVEERLYRHRCVEAWSMAVPWTGFPLAKLLALVDRLPGRGGFVRFVSAARPSEMPGWYGSRRVFPYYEALTYEEATHELAFVATGIYGHRLPAQHGAPIRIVLPWKYGFKSAKSIEGIQLTDERPGTFWNTLSPKKYSWAANVDPTETIPWPQSQETPLGSDEPRPTLPFNGYGEWVAKLYA